ncbi:hypothetical protein DSOUD_2760 [Desulfuromonas soudanensis]|uniref:Pilus formation protein N-terminal domain-containing protein n=1 Tax=Desulfuromonas soudanensis TaxID=1603606 RepID=A0A0M5INP9_9BACT|nr:hypothetical protein [Desulfuromonas soudanensis]ALC17498.1 hypothetical protein DSOUD_2760 [Desulfuromonas soudanensis]
MPMKKSQLLLIALFFVLLASQGLAAGLEKVQFLKISPQDQKGVIKTPAGALQLVGVGDVIAGDARIIEIAEGRVVLEQLGEGGPETVIIRLDGKHQRIERIRKQGDEQPLLLAPGPMEAVGQGGMPGYR